MSEQYKKYLEEEEKVEESIKKSLEYDFSFAGTILEDKHISLSCCIFFQYWHGFKKENLLAIGGPTGMKILDSKTLKVIVSFEKDSCSFFLWMNEEKRLFGIFGHHVCSIPFFIDSCSTSSNNERNLSRIGTMERKTHYKKLVKMNERTIGWISGESLLFYDLKLDQLRSHGEKFVYNGEYDPRYPRLFIMHPYKHHQMLCAYSYGQFILFQIDPESSSSSSSSFDDCEFLSFSELTRIQEFNTVRFVQDGSTCSMSITRRKGRGTTSKNDEYEYILVFGNEIGRIGVYSLTYDRHICSFFKSAWDQERVHSIFTDHNECFAFFPHYRMNVHLSSSSSICFPIVQSNKMMDKVLFANWRNEEKKKYFVTCDASGCLRLWKNMRREELKNQSERIIHIKELVQEENEENQEQRNNNNNNIHYFKICCLDSTPIYSFRSFLKKCDEFIAKKKTKFYVANTRNTHKRNPLMRYTHE